MMTSSTKPMWLATVVFGVAFAAGAQGQATTNPGTVAPASGTPADPTAPTTATPAGTMGDPAAPTTATAVPAGTMSKGDLKEQRKQQKRVEAAAKANVKAADASAKSKVANDKALQAQEKAGQVIPAPAAATPPPASAAPETSGPPQ